MIELKNVSKKYKNKTAVDNLSFIARDNRVTGFLGPNSSGKTTSFKILLGLAKKDSGAALVDGVNYVDLSQPSKHVGALLDARGFHKSRTAKQHLAFIAAAMGAPQSP